MNKALPWREYLGKVQKKAAFVDEAFHTSEKTLTVLAEKYGLTIQVPTIYITKNGKDHAEATRNDQIHISEGCINATAKLYERLKKAEIISDTEGTVRMRLCWTIVHEFFHIGRSHWAAYDACGGKRHGKWSLPGLEFDADQMAFIGLLRFEEISSPISPALVLRLLEMVFWPLREEVGDTIAAPAGDHPSWHVRLASLVHKLSIIGVPRGQDAKYEALIDARGRLLSSRMIELDRLRSKARGESHAESKFQLFMIRDFPALWKEVFDAWLKVEKQVRKLQRFSNLSG